MRGVYICIIGAISPSEQLRVILKRRYSYINSCLESFQSLESHIHKGILFVI